MSLGTSLKVNRALFEWTTTTEQALERLVERNHSSDGETFETLQAVRRDFDRAASAMGPAFDALRSDLDAERVSGRERAASLEAVRAELGRLEREHAALRDNAASLEAVRAEFTRLEREYAALRGHASALEHRASQLARDLDETGRRVDKLLASASWRLTAPLRAVWRLLRGLES